MTRGNFLSIAVPVAAAPKPRPTDLLPLRVVPYAPLAPSFDGTLPVYSTTVILHDVSPPIGISVSNISAIRLTWAFQDNRTLWITFDRMDASECVIAFRDKRGRTGTVEMAAHGCGQPPIGFEIIVPTQPSEHPFMTNPPDLVRYSAHIDIDEFSDGPIAMAQGVLPTPFTIYIRSSVEFGNQGGAYRVRLFDDQARSTTFSSLREISKSEIPPEALDSRLSSLSAGDFNYYSAAVRGDVGKTYAVQLLEPEPWCSSPVVGYVKTPDA